MQKYFRLLMIGVTVLLYGIGNGSVAYAGTSCEGKSPNPAYLAEVGDRAIYLKKVLDQLHPQVALIARVGSNLEKYHLHYSHVAYVVHDYPGRKGQWTVVHLLNQCGTDHSSIYTQGLFNFFMDDLYNLDFEVITPNPQLQAKLYTALTSPLKLQMHDPHYSMLAYPYAIQYQNSNQWVLEVLAAANYNVNSRASAQRVLHQNHYTPTTLQVSAISQLGASLFKTNIKFDDHPPQERQDRRYSIVTVDSVVDFLNRLGNTHIINLTQRAKLT